MGLSGLGDLILTCTSPQSRNFTFGVNLGRGHNPKTIQDTTGLAEGAFTASVMLEMARARSVDMPISSAVAALLEQKMSVEEAIESLLARPLKGEG
jgi:glycerol-3-phosphate dehydrogenase (NAD(P)+)